MKAPNIAKKANAEVLDIDKETIAQNGESGSLNIATVTVLKTTDPCNKKICLNEATGDPEKIPLAHISYAEATTHEVPDTASLRSFLETVSEQPDRAVTLCSFKGIPPGEPFTVLSTKKMRERLKLPANSATPDTAVEFDGKYYTTREKKNCTPSSWTYFDYDKVQGMPKKLLSNKPEEWLKMMGKLVPGFNDADKMLVGSTSARISYHDAPAFDGGWHCFVQVKNADDVEDFGKRLLMHSLSTEYGFMREIYSKTTGQVVGHRPWTIFDPSTFSPERLLFEGKPVVEGKGLAVLPATFQIIGGKS